MGGRSREALTFWPREKRDHFDRLREGIDRKFSGAILWLLKGDGMDLETLNQPATARKFLEDFEVPGKGKVTHIFTSSSKKPIFFSEMNDEEAVKYAQMIYRDIVEPATRKRRQ